MNESAIDRIRTPEGREAVHDLAMQEARTAFERDGHEIFAMPFHDAAVHEASHAVIYVAQGRKVLSLEIFEQSKFRRRRELEKQLKKIKRTGGNVHKAEIFVREVLKLPAWGGWCNPEQTADDLSGKVYRPADDPQHAEMQVRNMVAGYVGELILNSRTKKQPGASSLDERMTAQMTCAAAFGENGEREWYRIVSEVMAMLHRFWPVVLDVAALLEKAPPKDHSQHFLEGPELDAALARVTPDANDNFDLEDVKVAS